MLSPGTLVKGEVKRFYPVIMVASPPPPKLWRAPPRYTYPINKTTCLVE